ncbi:MAG: response regulator transcription factor [Clostridiales bacterium]|nr:response regulator transcription factor [Clostridiales bacterium]
MNIAICDDNSLELKKIAEIVESYASQGGMPVRFKTFTSAQDMLSAAREEFFTHYLLDILMPGMNGISVAREIRSFDAEAKIIFLTSTTEYAYQSYRVKAYDYLLKPVQSGELIDLFRQIQAQEESFQDCLSIQNGRSIFRIPFYHLSHLEVNQKKLYFYMADDCVRQLTGSISAFEDKLLSHPGFAKIHRSYIVNMQYVSVLSSKGCLMFSGKNLPVSRLLYNDVQKQYMTYLFSDRED